MSMLKRREKRDDDMNETWLIPYADILTLLLALFIVLFAASEIDAKKYKQLSESFHHAFQGGSGVLQHDSATESFEHTSPIPKLGEASPSPEQDHAELERLQEDIEGYIDEKGLSAKLKTELTSQYLRLTITEDVLFQSGSADVSGEARTIALDIADLLVSDPPKEIRIEGHTDNQPIQNADFPSNWELSSSRAINFMKILLENETLDPKKFSAIGYGEYQPVSSNQTAAGRSQNRRVEVLISPYHSQK